MLVRVGQDLHKHGLSAQKSHLRSSAVRASRHAARDYPVVRPCVQAKTTWQVECNFPESGLANPPGPESRPDHGSNARKAAGVVLFEKPCVGASEQSSQWAQADC